MAALPECTSIWFRCWCGVSRLRPAHLFFATQRFQVIITSLHLSTRCYERFMRTVLFCLIVVLPILPTPSLAVRICGDGRRVTCGVDGAVFWLPSEKIRTENIDAPAE